MWSRVLNEVIEWNVFAITCVQQSFRWIVWQLIDGGPRDSRHRHRLEHDGGEVRCVPSLVGSIAFICGLLERKYDAVDQDRRQADCYRC